MAENKEVVVAETKKPWQSKTNWIALIVAIAAFIPSVSEWISGNPEAFGAIMGGLFLVLRALTKSKISIE